MENEKNLTEKAARIKLIILDADGVLTDGKIIMSNNSDEVKTFNVRDGHGLVLAKRFNLEIAIVSGRESSVLKARAKEFGIELLFMKIWDKLSVYEEIKQKTGLKDEEIAIIGDDIVDLPMLKRAGLSVAPSDAEEEVLSRVDWVTTRPGGGGAVREMTDFILKSKGLWDEVMKKYLQ